MKKVFLLTVSFIVLVIQQNICAIMLTSHNEGPEDVFKNPAVSAFSQNSWIFIADYNALDYIYKDDLKLNDVKYDFDIETASEYNSSVSIGNIGSLPGDRKYVIALSGAQDYMAEYKEQKTEISAAGEVTYSTEYDIFPKLSAGFSGKINSVLSYGVILDTSYQYEYINKKKENPGIVIETTEKNQHVTAGATFGLYMKSEEYKSELGFMLSSGEITYSKSFKSVDDSSLGQNEKNLINYIEYSASPRIGLGAFIFLTDSIGIGFEGFMQLPGKYETNFITDDVPISTEKVVIENSPMVMNRIIISWSPSENFGIQSGFSKIYMFNSSHDPDFLYESGSDFDVLSADILFKYSKNGMSYYAGSTYNHSNFSAKQVQAGQNVDFNVSSHAVKVSVGVGRSY